MTDLETDSQHCVNQVLALSFPCLQAALSLFIKKERLTTWNADGSMCQLSYGYVLLVLLLSTWKIDLSNVCIGWDF